jgi:hypothetical protein
MARGAERVLAAGLALLASGCASAPRWPAESLRGTNVTNGVTAEDLSHFSRDWGGKIVRVLHLSPLSDQAPYAADEKVLQGMFEATDLALKEGLHVVFCPGVAMDNHDRFFSSPEYRKAFVRLWQRVAKRYQGNPAPIAYDLMNEPHDVLARTEWASYARELTRAIREIDARHTIIVEPTEWGWPEGFDDIEPTGDANTVYSFHYYGPQDLTFQRGYDERGKMTGFETASDDQWMSRIYPGKIQGDLWDRSTLERRLGAAFRFRDRYHVPIWCGEFGVTRWAKGALEWFRDMIETLEAHQVGWAYYSYREWQPLDLEMDAEARNRPSARGETEFVKLLKAHFAR